MARTGHGPQVNTPGSNKIEFWSKIFQTLNQKKFGDICVIIWKKKTTKKICLFEGLSSIGFTIYNVFGDDLVNLKIYLNVKRFSWIWVKENQLYIKLYFKNKCIWFDIVFWFYYTISRSKIIKSNIVSYGNY